MWIIFLTEYVRDINFMSHRDRYPFSIFISSMANRFQNWRIIILKLFNSPKLDPNSPISHTHLFLITSILRTHLEGLQVKSIRYYFLIHLKQKEKPIRKTRPSWHKRKIQKKIYTTLYLYPQLQLSSRQTSNNCFPIDKKLTLKARKRHNQACDRLKRGVVPAM